MKYPDPHYVRDVVIIGVGSGCILSQIIAQIKRVEISAELVIAGVTLLTATPFLWKGDKRANDKENTAV